MLSYTIKKQNRSSALFLNGLPARARTVDPLIKSQMLYQLSYGEIVLDISIKNIRFVLLNFKWSPRTGSNRGPSD